jgi:hypothetical protein
MNSTQRPKETVEATTTYPDRAWSPSTDIAAAWEVAEKLGAWRLRVDPVRDGSGRKHYGCFFYREYNRLLDDWAERTGRDPAKEPRPQKPWHTTIDAAPLAICRAALKAVESATIIVAKPQAPNA